MESGQHFVLALERQHYAQERADSMLEQPRACVRLAAMAAFEAMVPVDQRFWPLLDANLWIGVLDNKQAVVEGRRK